MKIAIATLGCKVNQYESVAIVEAIEGAVLVPFGDAADCCIVNTCAVTAESEHQSRQLIRRAARANPKAKIIVTGCYAQIATDALEKIDGITAILGNSRKATIPKLIAEMFSGDQPQIAASSSSARPLAQIGAVQNLAAFDSLRAHGLPGHTRATLKIQDGCGARCSYCVVPVARGKSRTMSPTDVLHEAALLAAIGYKETVLTGIHLGAYGEDIDPPLDLSALLEMVIASGRHTKRIRLSSIEPREINEKLLFLMAKENSPICHHLHIPLQSGDDEILARMNRNYNALFFESLIETIAAKVPDIAIGVDVMVGFPSETDEQFANTHAIIEKLPISYCHVFPYSPRTGTFAATLKNDVGDTIKKRRAKMLRALSDAKRAAFANSLVGKTLDALIESKLDKETGFIKGLSGNYQTVAIGNMKGNYENRIMETLVERSVGGKIFGACQGFAD